MIQLQSSADCPTAPTWIRNGSARMRTWIYMHRVEGGDLRSSRARIARFSWNPAAASPLSGRGGRDPNHTSTVSWSPPPPPPPPPPGVRFSGPPALVVSLAFVRRYGTPAPSVGSVDDPSLVLLILAQLDSLTSHLMNIVASVQGLPRSDEHLRHSSNHRRPTEPRPKSWLAKRQPRRNSGGWTRLVSSSERETCSRQQEQDRTTRFARVYYFSLSCFN